MATNLLKSTSLNVTEIAVSCGFSSSTHFRGGEVFSVNSIFIWLLFFSFWAEIFPNAPKNAFSHILAFYRLHKHKTQNKKLSAKVLSFMNSVYK